MVMTHQSPPAPQRGVSCCQCQETSSSVGVHHMDSGVCEVLLLPMGGQFHCKTAVLPGGDPALLLPLQPAASQQPIRDVGRG